jgi:hypothetical protein
MYVLQNIFNGTITLQISLLTPINLDGSTSQKTNLNFIPIRLSVGLDAQTVLCIVLFVYLYCLFYSIVCLAIISATQTI